MLLRADVSLTLIAQTEIEADQLIHAWIQGLITMDLIIEGGVSFIERLEEEEDFPEPDEPLYNFPGYDNYPGHPL